MGGSRGGTGGPDTPLKNHKNIGFLSNTGPDPLKNHKATKLAFNVGPPSARQRNAIKMAFRWRGDDGPLLVVLKMAFRWRADDGPLLVVFESSSFSSTKQKEKRYQIWTPSDKTFRIRACNGPIASRGVSLKATRSFLGNL